MSLRHNVSAPERSLDFAFIDASIPPCVENAIHALALDEIRRPFSPTIWEKPSKDQSLTQVWFCGSHADVGGCYNDTSSANITLAWMIGQLSKYVDFDAKILEFQLQNPSAKEKR